MSNNLLQFVLFTQLIYIYIVSLVGLTGTHNFRTAYDNIC